MAVNGLLAEDIAGLVGGVDNVMTFGVNSYPRYFERLGAALGVTPQFLYYGRNFVRTPMGRAA
jgi:hypothetical protein